MNALQCNSCGATLLADASFCRQCGAPVSAEQRVSHSGYANAPFRGESENVTTRRLDPLPTNQPGGMQFQPPYIPAPLVSPPPPRAKANPMILGTLALIALLLGIITIVAVVKMRTPTRIVKVVGQGATARGELMYPGADTLIDVASPDGSRVLKLSTSDPLQSVQHFYETALQSPKTVALSNLVVVIKNDKVTATLVTEGNRTNIIIKQVP